jgi:HSP20 family protein
MSSLTVREHVLNDFLSLKEDFERVFHHIFRQHLHPTQGNGAWFAVVPPIESWIDTADKKFHLSVPFPGIKPEALNVTIQGNILTFTGEQEKEDDKSTKNYIEREFSYGRFTRSITLPDGVDGEKLTAELKDGILEISAPIDNAVLPKKVEVKNLTAG